MEKSVIYDEKNPLVSVLVACYNHEAYVEASVRSIMSQQGVAFEVIVIDDGSSDHSPEILKRLSDELHFKYVHRPNKGLVATLNELLSMAKGKFYCTFATDDLMPPGRLKKQSDFLSKHCGAMACFGQIIPMDGEGNISPKMDSRYLRSVPQVTFEESFLGKKALHGCSEMFVTEKIRALGGYDSRYYFEDYPLFLKVLHTYGPQPVSADFACCFYREHGNNLHCDNDRIFKEILRVLSENYGSHPLYKQALKNWKANWFSALASQSKIEALKRLPKLASFSVSFFKRLPKLFIPKSLHPF